MLGQMGSFRRERHDPFKPHQFPNKSTSFNDSTLSDRIEIHRYRNNEHQNSPMAIASYLFLAIA